MKPGAIVSALVVFSAGVALNAGNPVQSHWRTEDVRIDGVMTDWPGQVFLSKEVSASIVNDAQDLYILVATADPGVKLQLTRAGLSIYVDPKGGKAEAFGVRIPPLGNRLSPGNAPTGAQDDEMVLSYFDVLGPGADDIRRVEVAEGSGIDLRIGTDESMFFVELKVPFVTGAGHPYAPGINLTKGEVGLGIVTPDPQRVIRTGPGGRGGLFAGGGRGAGMPSPPKGKAVEIWTKVVLAKGS